MSVTLVSTDPGTCGVGTTVHAVPFERVPGPGRSHSCRDNIRGRGGRRQAAVGRCGGRPPWEGAAMRRIVLVVAGLAAVLAGLVWTLQGLGYVGGSFMSGATVWAVIGPLVALAGLALIVVGLRARHRVR